MAKPEKQIQQEILYYLHLLKEVKFFWRNNTGAVRAQYKGKNRFIRFGEPGISDILGILKDGRFLAIEVKTDSEINYLFKHYKAIKYATNKTKKRESLRKQIVFIETINNAGGLAFFTSTVKDVINTFVAEGYLSKQNAIKIGNKNVNTI